MKFLLILAIVLAIFATSQAKPKKSKNECTFCSIGVDKDINCVCSHSTRVPRKYACGPACDALGYCCESIPKACPVCGSGENPTNDPECVCAATALRRLVKYACGPACDALGYCCDAATETTKAKDLKCVKIKK